MTNTPNTPMTPAEQLHFRNLSVIYLQSYETSATLFYPTDYIISRMISLATDCFLHSEPDANILNGWACLNGSTLRDTALDFAARRAEYAHHFKPAQEE